MEIKTYDPKRPISYYYRNIKCFGRTKVCFITNDLVVVADKVSKGWTFSRIDDGFFLQAPEVWLVDISEPAKISYYSNSIVNNYAYFLYLKSKKDSELIALIKNLLGDSQEIFLSKGDSQEVEIRVILENKNSSSNLMFDLYSEFLQSKEYKKYLRESEKIVKKNKVINIQRDKEVGDYPPKVAKFFSEVIKYYSFINLGRRDLYSRDFVPAIEKQVEEHFGDADLFVFIPWGCFKYIANFVSDKTIDKVMLWETHLLKYETHEHQFRKRDLKNKKVIIFDKGYTGGTLNKMAKLIRKQGGEPVRVAIFPKSRLAIKNSDFVFFVDKLFESSKINIADPEYYSSLYKEIFS